MAHDHAMRGSGKKRLPRDAYDTIEAGVLIEALTLPKYVWEPHAGAGLLVKALKPQCRVYASDIEPRANNIHMLDFLKAEAAPDGVRGIVMNPPYQDIDNHIRHALALMEPVSGMVALLARSELSHAKKRADLFSRNPAFDEKIELTRRPKWFADGKGSPRHNFAWFIWDWEKTKFVPSISSFYPRKDVRDV